MNLSVYTSAFNLSNGLYDLEGAVSNWAYYANEIVVATFPDQVGEVSRAFQSISERLDIKAKVVAANTSLKDPLFDGELKNEALQNCSNAIVIQQDLDERLSGLPSFWGHYGQYLLKKDFFCSISIPTIDLFKDWKHYKSVGSKWYMHTKEGTFRGPVNFAIREDGTIDTNKSDTCELINANGDLLPAFRFFDFTPEANNADIPHVFHLGYLDLEKRVASNKFWGPVWTLRNGDYVDVDIHADEIEAKNEAKKHTLPLWPTKTFATN